MSAYECIFYTKNVKINFLFLKPQKARSTFSENIK